MNLIKWLSALLHLQKECNFSTWVEQSLFLQITKIVLWISLHVTHKRSDLLSTTQRELKLQLTANSSYCWGKEWERTNSSAHRALGSNEFSKENHSDPHCLLSLHHGAFDLHSEAPGSKTPVWVFGRVMCVPDVVSPFFHRLACVFSSQYKNTVNVCMCMPTREHLCLYLLM